MVMKFASMVSLAVLIPIGTAGCVRRTGRNVECVWPVETTSVGELSEDAEFAEELADRYALKTARQSRDIQVFNLARKQCLDKMFAVVARVHSTTPTEVAQSLGANRALIDIALNLPFIFLYALGSVVAARRIWRRWPPSDGGLGATIILAFSLVFSVIGVLVGEQWSIVMETLRIGNGHLGVRAGRLPWVRHPVPLALLLVVVFCAVAARERRFEKSETLS